MREALLFVADCALKGTVVLTAAAVLGWCGRRRSAGTRHLIWLAAFLVLLMLPLGEAIVPARIGWMPAPATLKSASVPDLPLSKADLASLPPVSLGDADIAPIEDRPTPRRLSLSEAALSLWGGGVLSICLYVFVGLGATLRLRRRSVPYERKEGLRELKRRVRVGRPVDARVNRGSVPEVAMTWGSLWPVILLPRSSATWPEEQEQAILLHELAHVRRLDWLTQLLASLACALYWFNPAVWLAARRLRAESESSADDLVLRLGQCPSAYAASLLRVASELGARRPFLVTTGVTAMKSRKIEQRIQAILDPNRPRRGSTRLDLLAMAAVAALVAIPLSGVKAQTPARLALTPPSLALAQDDLMPVEKFYELKRGSHREVVERHISDGSQSAVQLIGTSRGFDSVETTRLGEPSYLRRLARRGIHVRVITQEQASAIVAKTGPGADGSGGSVAQRMARVQRDVAGRIQRMARVEEDAGARIQRILAETQARQAETLARIQTSKARLMEDRMRALAQKQQALAAAQAERTATPELKRLRAEIQKQMAEAGKAQDQALVKMRLRLLDQKPSDAGVRDQIAEALSDAQAAQEKLRDNALELKLQGAANGDAKARALDDDSAKGLIQSLTDQSAAQSAKVLSDLTAERAVTAKQMAHARDELAKSLADQKLQWKELDGADALRLQGQLKQLQGSKDWIELKGPDSLKLQEQLKGLQDSKRWRELNGPDSLKLQGELKELQDSKRWRELKGSDSLKLQGEIKGLQDSKRWRELKGPDSLKLQGELKQLQESKDWQRLRSADALNRSLDLSLKLRGLQDQRSDWDHLDLSERKARVDKAQVELAETQREYEQLSKLYKTGAAPQTDLLKQRSKLDIARINLQIAKLMQRKAELQQRTGKR